jgi:hypothetical protein
MSFFMNRQWSGSVQKTSMVFVDWYFVRSSPIAGDFAGQTAEATLRAMEANDSSSGDQAEYVR